MVDPELRFHDPHAVRVADAGVMPTLVSGNNAACVMIGEKCADLMHAAR